MKISGFFSQDFGLRLRVARIPEARGLQASGFSLGFSFRVPGCRLPACCVLQRSLALTPAVRRRLVNGYNAYNIHNTVQWCVSSIHDHAKNPLYEYAEFTCAKPAVQARAGTANWQARIEIKPPAPMLPPPIETPTFMLRRALALE
jgi:hypothetical protein